MANKNFPKKQKFQKPQVKSQPIERPMNQPVQQAVNPQGQAQAGSQPIKQV